MTADTAGHAPGPAPRQTASDESFKQSMARFARRIGERVSAQPSADARAAAERRQAALRAYDRARLRQGLLVGSVALAVLALLTVGTLVVIGLKRPVPTVAQATDAAPPALVVAAEAVKPPARAVDMAQAQTPQPSAPPEPRVTVPAPEAAPAVTAEELRTPPPSSPVAADAMQPPQPAPAYLRRDEVREVQQRLWSFGFNAGPVDGAAGPRTQAAVLEYRQSRGLLPQVDTVDYALLEVLRQDPAPRVGRPPPPTAVAQADRPPPRRRSSNPFDQIAQWFQSLGR